jgi:putative tricarboxylic transport membrane protein
MFDALIEGLVLVLQWKAFSLMMIGMGLGFIVGLLPGIGGAATLAMMLPFIFKMSPAEAFAFLLGMHAVAATTGDITSILFGVPGEAISAATVVDGYPMAKNGEAGRALGAALMSSLIGALIGALVLALAIPIVRPLVLSFGSPELLMLAVMGIACITSLSGLGARSQIRGFSMGLLGLLLSTIGQERQSGLLRFDMGMMYLWDGLDLVPVLVGIFAIPEIIDLAVRGTAIAGEKQPGNLQAGVMEGIKDTFRHFWLVVRCSAISSESCQEPEVGSLNGSPTRTPSRVPRIRRTGNASAKEIFAEYWVRERRTIQRKEGNLFRPSPSECPGAGRWGSCWAAF